MASLPGYVCIEQNGWSEAPAPSVQRTEMERGPAKEKILNSSRQPRVTASFVFRSKADAIAFEDWWEGTLGIIGWFDMIHPLRGTTITARFVGGDIGELSQRSREVYTRTATMEYIR